MGHFERSFPFRAFAVLLGEASNSETGYSARDDRAEPSRPLGRVEFRDRPVSEIRRVSAQTRIGYLK